MEQNYRVSKKCLYLRLVLKIKYNLNYKKK